MISRTLFSAKPCLMFLAAVALSGCTLQLGDGSDTDDDVSAEASSSSVELPPDVAPADPNAELPPPEDQGEPTDEDDTDEDDDPIEEPELPSVVTINLRDAVIRPYDSSFEHWDNSAPVSDELINGLSNALIKSQPYAAVASFLFSFFWDELQPPDPQGHARIFSDGYWQLPIDLDGGDYYFSDTFVPQFGGVGWKNVPLEPDVRIEITLSDYDDFLGGDDDPMGTVELNYDDLVEAWEAQQVHGVRVDDQSLGTILFVGISVLAQE